MEGSRLDSEERLICWSRNAFAGARAEFRVLGLAAFNDAGAADALALLLDCCAAPRWAERVARGRPYPSLAALLTTAEQAFEDLSRAEWLEAFAAHARIGAPRDGDLRGASEQAGARDADPQTLAALAEDNRAYEERFGHLFLICARGLGGAEILAALRRRLDHGPKQELAIAAAEQRKIAALRLREVLSP